MERDLVRDGLRFKLAKQYRDDPTVFLSLSKEAIDSALGREIVAELRNEGHIEEEVRGKIRLTPRGYRAFQSDPPPYSYRNCMTPRVVSGHLSSTMNLAPMIIFAVNRFDFFTHLDGFPDARLGRSAALESMHRVGLS